MQSHIVIWYYDFSEIINNTSKYSLHLYFYVTQ
jgi:hypothetical protein